MNKTCYVLGFMFDKPMERVVLIRKNKPAWQAGKLNGIGGKVEGDESPMDAILREFKEETGMQTNTRTWSYFLRMSGPDFCVETFAAIGDLEKPTTQESEEVCIVKLPFNQNWGIENLPWLIGAAIDHLQDGRPAFLECTYP